jgi:hypothetical protein
MTSRASAWSSATSNNCMKQNEMRSVLILTQILPSVHTREKKALSLLTQQQLPPPSAANWLRCHDCQKLTTRNNSRSNVPSKYVTTFKAANWQTDPEPSKLTSTPLFNLNPSLGHSEVDMMSWVHVNLFEGSCWSITNIWAIEYYIVP